MNEWMVGEKNKDRRSGMQTFGGEKDVISMQNNNFSLSAWCSLKAKSHEKGQQN